MSSQAADGAHAARLANVDPNDPWRGVDPMGPAVRENPHPYLAHLREVAPVHRPPLGLWRLTRYADVERLLTDVPAGVRRSDGTRIGEARLPGGPSEFMLQQDPPDHTRLRRLVSKAFTPNAVTRLRAH